MNCRKAERLLDRYIESDLTGAENSRIEPHLQTCGSCRQVYENRLKLIENFSAFGNVESPERELWYGIRNRITQDQRRRVIITVPRFAFITGIFLIAAGLFTGLFLGTNRNNSPSRIAAVETDTTTEGGQYLEEFRILETEYREMREMQFESARKYGIDVPAEILKQIESDLAELDTISERIFSTLEGYSGDEDYYILVYDHYRRKFQILKDLRNIMITTDRSGRNVL